MYTQAFIAFVLAGLAAATPIEKRQTQVTSKEFSQGGCKDVMFAFARGSTEAGNMGTVVGPQTSDAIKAKFGAASVATEGIDYAAALAPNSLPGGTDAKSKQSMQDTLNAMASQCPDSVIVAGGYSQGAAVSHRAIESLDPAVQGQIAGVILYGDTQKQQDNAQIPNFPQDKTKIICAPGDLVCVGTLTILPAHLSYGANAKQGADFLNQKITAAMATKAAAMATKAAAMATKAAAKAKRGAEAMAKRGVETVFEQVKRVAVEIVA